eukprot:EG_transcript_16180
MTLHPNAYMATTAFLAGCTFGPALLSLLQRLPPDHPLTLALLGHQLVVHSVVCCLYRRVWQDAITASFLGSVLSFSVAMAFLAPAPWPMLWAYFAALAFFHWSEYVAMCWCQPGNVSWHCYMLNHSTAYWLAHAVSITESLVTFTLFPFIKLPALFVLGLAMVVGGELVRKAGMFTAATSFSHRIAMVKQPEHELITHGIYSCCRHPAYVGWFWWSIGTQVMLCNPVSCLGFTLASWRFFYDRINFEEELLLHFFGQPYRDYQQAVGTGLPFIQGAN